jgi:serine/threonine protein kinase
VDLYADRYRLQGELGHGGYGTVFRAHDDNTGRDVALKVFNRVVRSSVAFREAHILTALEGPHVLRMFDADVWNDTAHMSSAIAALRSVQDQLGDKGVSEQRARLWVVHLLRGLEAMHRLGLVHRDVKPANLMLDSPEHARLGDFGTTAALDSGVVDAEGDPSVRAPEMYAIGRGDVRSDVYSVGATLWRCLTGHWPFPAEQKMTAEEYGRWVLGGLPRRLRDVAPHVSSRLARIAEKALSLDPADRYQTAGEMEVALSRLPVPRRWWREVEAHPGHVRCWKGDVAAGSGSAVVVCVSTATSGRSEITTQKLPSGNRVREHCRVERNVRLGIVLRGVFDSV